jgi:5'-nucleotidase
MGTPCDCVRLGVIKLLDHKPDLVLSGINHGGNLGWDVFFSGTVSAAAEAYSFGVPAIAFSLCTWTKADWAGLDQLCASLCRKLLEAASGRARWLYSVNIPALSIQSIRGVKLTQQEPHVKGDNFVERTSPDGRRYFWPTWEERQAERDRVNDEKYDSGAVKAGYISVTPLRYEVSDVADDQARRVLADFSPRNVLG